MSNRIYMAALLAGASLVCMPQLAHAQEADAQGSPATDASKETDAGAIGEIVVTARKREENLQTTPISITALGAAQLDAQGVSSIMKLQDLSPNITFANVPSNSGIASNAAIYIRGIGQNDFAPSVDPGVGIYVDGLYQGRSVGGVFDLIDIDRVEVLRGPQGTLFGRNTIGGAISITTAPPTDSFAAKADFKLGSDDRINVRGMVNIPITDSLFMKVSGGVFSQDGYINAVNLGTKFGNQNNQVARGALRWIAAPNFEVTLSGDFMRDKSNGAPLVSVGPEVVPPGVSFAFVNNLLATNFGANGNCADAANATNPNCFNSQWFSRTENYSTDKTFSDIESWSAGLTMKWDITDDLMLKSISGYRHVDGVFSQDYDQTPLDIANLPDDYFTQRQFTQELQLIGTALDDRLDYLVGLYYFQEKGQDIGLIDFNLVLAQTGGYYDYHSWAAFGQTTFKITDKLSLTAGLRYTQDRKKFLPDQFVIDTPLPAFLDIPAGTRIVPFETVRANVNKLTPMVNLAYQWTPDIMTYATFAQGFKGGGYTQRIFPPEPSLPSFKPEKVNSYEVGVKMTTLDRMLRLNLSGFYTDYSDLQLLVADPSRVGPFYTNAGDARITGFEAELTLAPGGGWRVTGSAGLTDAKYTRLVGGVQGLTLDSKFILVPKWTLNGSIENRIELGGGSSLTPRADWSFRSGAFTNANGINVPFLYQPAYSLFNANVRWESADEKYSLQFGVDNIADKKFQSYGNFQPAFGTVQASYDRGRQWYLRGSFSY